MPQKDRYQICQRNELIRKTFYFYLQSGMSRMLAYAKTASEYYLSEGRVRDIVAKRGTM